MEDKVLDTVVNMIKYTFKKDILVKPLETSKVTVEYTEQIPTGEKDEEGFNKYETKTHTKEVDSEFSRGIVIALPTNKSVNEANDLDFKLGDIIVYPAKFAKSFDLFKNSQLVKPYDIVAIEHTQEAELEEKEEEHSNIYEDLND